MTAAVERLRKHLERRHRDGQSYLVRAARGWQLYVPSTVPGRRPEPVGRGVFVGNTVDSAQRAGVVDVGHDIGEHVRPDLPPALLAAYDGDRVWPEVRRIALAPTGDAVTGLAPLQTDRGRTPGGSSYDVHLVRATDKGTPGPMLCGYERFGPDAPGWGFGGVSGPTVTQVPCPGCVDAARLLYPGLLPYSNSPQSVAVRAALDTRKAS